MGEACTAWHHEPHNFTETRPDFAFAADATHDLRTNTARLICRQRRQILPQTQKHMLQSQNHMILAHVILVVKPSTPEVVFPTRDMVPFATPLPNAVGLFIKPSAGS